MLPLSQVIGDRELCFYPGVARGAAYRGFDYATEAGAAAAALQYALAPRLLDFLAPYDSRQPSGPVPFDTSQLASDGPVSVSSSGGAGAGDATVGNRQHSATESNAPAPQPLWLTTYDYCNGGPVFCELHHGDDAGCAASPAMSTSGCSSSSACTSSSSGSSNRISSSSSDGNNFNHSADLGSAAGRHVDGSSYRVLARYGDLGGAIAAVRCEVGAGVAVLCGTHPELPVSWIRAEAGVPGDVVASAAARSQSPGTAGGSDSSCDGPNASRREVEGGSGSGSYQTRVALLKQRLQAADASRRMYFCALLATALKLVH